MAREDEFPEMLSMDEQAGLAGGHAEASAAVAVGFGCDGRAEPRDEGQAQPRDQGAG